MAEQHYNSPYFLGNLELRDVVVPVAVLVGGAVVGRMFGFKILLRGAMAALALATAVKDAGRVDEPVLESTRGKPRRKPGGRAAVEHPARKGYEYKLSTQPAEVAAPAA